MARQRKPLTEQIEILDGQIAKLQEKLDILTKQREELIVKKREEELSELYKFMQDNQISIQDLYGMIQPGEEDNWQTA
ncbi:hypothetical protein [Luxibacter massiliensis]|uniref:hypothetical protein n=1 Tax=Luxibacter massiliensis TaxID=2219695 RepID=UPI000F06F601|nr:hypothetical protein [Luxibacter massiliensis]